MQKGQSDRRQYARQSVMLPCRLDGVTANGTTHVIDVSAEGLRLVMPPDRRWVPPPYFNVRIPLIGSAVTVQRMWTRPWPAAGRPEATWCGVSLAKNGALAEQAWRSLVSTIPLMSGSSNSLQVL